MDIHDSNDMFLIILRMNTINDMEKKLTSSFYNKLLFSTIRKKEEYQNAFSHLNNVLLILIGRYYSYYNGSIWKGKAYRLPAFQKQCRLQRCNAESGFIAINWWKIPLENGEPITKNEFIKQALDKFNEVRCPICFTEMNENTDFSILSDCSHLICVQCWETILIHSGNEKR